MRDRERVRERENREAGTGEGERDDAEAQKRERVAGTVADHHVIPTRERRPVSEQTNKQSSPSLLASYTYPTRAHPTPPPPRARIAPSHLRLAAHDRSRQSPAGPWQPQRAIRRPSWAQRCRTWTGRRRRRHTLVGKAKRPSTRGRVGRGHPAVRGCPCARNTWRSARPPAEAC